MSVQSDVGKTLYDLRDLVSNDLTKAVMTFARENELSDGQLKSLVTLLKGTTHQTFERGVDAVLKCLG